MNILCVINNLEPGGAQRQLVELALGFKEKGHIVTFLTYHHLIFFKPVLIKAGIPVTCISEPKYLKRLLKMRNYIRRGNFDAVLSFLEAPGFICEVAGLPFRKWKLITGERNANLNILKSIKRRSYRWFHVFADYIVANSSLNIQIIRSINPFLSDTKCKVIYNALDFDLWKPDPKYIPRKDGRTKIIVAARHHPQKNLNGLVEAVSLLPENERSKLKIDWYGDQFLEGGYDYILNEARKKIFDYQLEGIFSFYPATEDIRTKIQNADIVGLFSLYEGFPNSVCEGMACSKPVICSAVSDIPKLLSGNHKLLCDPNDYHSICETIMYTLQLSDKELIQIGEDNRRQAERVFAKESIINAYLHLLS
jgi:glycosyltransferase involved in cell wall biosynthesis